MATNEALSPTTTPSESRARKKHAVRTPRKYADMVTFMANSHPSSTLLTCPHLEPLATYLQHPFDLRVPQLTEPLTTVQASEHDDFVSMYDLDPDSQKREVHVTSVTEFEDHADQLLGKDGHGHVIFMRGHPSPIWLASIGAKYDVDPSFFQGHVGQRHSSMAYFEPVVALNSEPIVARLNSITIGRSVVDSTSSNGEEGHLDDLRLRMDSIVRDHSDKIANLQGGFATGDSIVRNFAVLDSRHFIVEQTISLWIRSQGNGWIAIVWLDHGHHLDQGPSSTFISELLSLFEKWQMQFLPVIQHRSSTVRSKERRAAASEQSSDNVTGLVQSASMLHKRYGHILKAPLADCSAFYALTEIFRFVAAGQAQLLNLLQSKLDTELYFHSISSSKKMSIANLLYYQQILERHIEQLHNNIILVRDSSGTVWPKGVRLKQDENKVGSSQQEVLEELRRLSHQANVLRDRCRAGMQMVMSNASIHESKKAIAQAEEVTKLTRLAFIFIPLSFINSVFGMNFREFGSGVLSLWIWGLIAPLAVFITFGMIHPSNVWSTLKQTLSWNHLRFLRAVKTFHQSGADAKDSAV